MGADMGTVKVVEEKGSFRLVERQGRFAVVEARGGQVYDVHAEDGEREGRPDGDAGVDAVARWTGEQEARALLGELAARGDQLARRIW